MKSKKGKNFARVSISVDICDKDGNLKPIHLCNGCSALIWEALNLESLKDYEDRRLIEALKKSSLGHVVKISLDEKKS